MSEPYYWDDIISKDKFRELPKEEQVRTMEHWRNTFDSATIAKGMRISRPNYYTLASELGVSKKYNTKNSKTARVKQSAKPVEVVKVEKAVKVAPEAVVSSPKAVVVNGLVLTYAGKYTADEIIKKLDKIGLILSDESNKFDVEIKITEVAK